MYAPGGLLLGAGAGLLPMPRKVQRVEVSYDRVAKVVGPLLLILPRPVSASAVSRYVIG